MTEIPKIIHTYYISNNIKFNTEFKRWVNFISLRYPDFEIKTWDVKSYSNIRYLKYCKSCHQCGEVGLLYLSYLMRFDIIKEHGGIFIEPFTYDINKLYFDEDFLKNKKYIFEVNSYNNINVNFFIGIAGQTGLKSPYNCILNSFYDKSIINPNGSLDLFNPNQYIGDKLNKQGYCYNNMFNNCNIDDVDFIYNIKKIDKYYSIPKLYQKTVSVVIPVYNAEKYIHECLSSILYQDFQDFEILCIDDGSTDNSAGIINSYNDDRIIYIKREHSGIVNSLNYGFHRALGKYIIRHDADDVMLPDRISYQVNFMENHQDIDILSNGYIMIDADSNLMNTRYSNPVGYVNLEMLINRNHLSHPCTCFKSESIKSLPFLYEQYYIHAEDYKLWCTAASYGLNIYSDGTPVIKYRNHSQQISTEKRNIMYNTSRIIQNAYSKKNAGDLTCIIPFQNEGIEIEHTVASIRGTANNVKIMLINDSSTDNFDYKKIAEMYDCDYYETEDNLGVAECREYGIKKCNTFYFLLLDGHMRFYDLNWDIKLLNILNKNRNSIVTGNTLVINYDNISQLYSNENHFGYNNICTRGALVDFDNLGNVFMGKWTNNEMPGYQNENVIPIACCMGAVYASNKTFWEKIMGLNGLAKWGQDEPYMSIKAWLAGGSVLLIKDLGVGHLYRNNANYFVPARLRLRNRIFLINFFSKDQHDIDNYLKKLKSTIKLEDYNDAIYEYNSNKEYLDLIKNNFWKNVAKYDLNWFITNINDPIKRNKRN